MPGWNFSSNILSSLPGDRRALTALARDGSRSEWTFGEVDRVSCSFAGALRDLGVAKGDVVLTFMGNTAEWVFALTAIWRLGGVAMPCNTQLTAHDLARRIELIGPKLSLVDGPRADAFARAGLEAVRAEALMSADSGPGADPGAAVDP